MSYLFEQLKAKEGSAQTADKILLMGLQQAGKSAIKDIVFFNKNPTDVENYMATIHYERQYIDEEKQNLVIDSGGQESYWNEAVTHFRHLVFSNVKLLLWIIDVTRPDLFEESERRFSFTIRQFTKENPKGMIAILCHKVDMIGPEELVPILDHIRESFDDPKYNITFEASSIYYPDSLKEIVFHLMKVAKMNIQRFELITNISEKVEESEEFQSYVIKHQDDPRIQQLLDFLRPESTRALPTFGKVTLHFDLTAYDIVEIVLIDKESYSPVIGTSSPSSVGVEKSMEYIMALQEFKDIIKARKEEAKSSALIFTSSNQKVHGILFTLETNLLLVTSFSPITEQKTKALYKLIQEFSRNITVTPGAEEEILQIPVETKILTTPKSEVATIDIEDQIEVNSKTQPIEVAQEIPIKKTQKSVFSFLNKLREEEIVQIDNQQPIEEINEPLEIKVENIQKSTEKLTEKKIIPEEIKTEPELKKEVVIEEKQIKEPIKKEEILVEEKPKSKSLFISKLREEEKKYKIKQVQLQSPTASKKAEEKIDISTEDISNLAEFLIKEEQSTKEEKST